VAVPVAVVLVVPAVVVAVLIFQTPVQVLRGKVMLAAVLMAVTMRRVVAAVVKVLLARLLAVMAVKVVLENKAQLQVLLLTMRVAVVELV
jgi:hypothetical protein